MKDFSNLAEVEESDDNENNKRMLIVYISVPIAGALLLVSIGFLARYIVLKRK